MACVRTNATERKPAVKQQRPNGKALSLNLGLQGGGAHGAFTWGVLDRLLEEENLTFNAVSGTSAGAMNGAALISGLANGGRDGARQALETFWRVVSDRGRFAPANIASAQAAFGALGIDPSALQPFLGAGMQLFSPYDFNPAGFNPLRKVIKDTIDLDAIARSPIAFFVTATHVGSGEARIFTNDEIGGDTLLASACLPTLFHAVEIDGEPYWDGGYTGNPSLMPLVHETGASDLLIVQTSPISWSEAPLNARQIALREKEISFNAPLIKELRFLAELKLQAGAGLAPQRGGGTSALSLLGGRLEKYSKGSCHPIADLRLHRIAGEEMNGRSGQSKMNSTWQFLKDLREEGRQAAGRFLTDHGAELGQRSTLDLTHWLQRPGRKEFRTTRVS